MLAQKVQPLPEKAIPNSTADLLIVGGTVVTMDKDRRVIEDGAVAIKNGEIVFGRNSRDRHKKSQSQTND